MRLRGPFIKSRQLAIGKTIYVRELRGRLIACKWPKKRPRPTHPTTIEQMEKFRQANWAAKYAPATIQVFYAEMVKGTSLLPRDLMVAAMYGRGFTWQVENQRRRYPVAALRDLSDTLDILGADPGDIIGRGADRWYAIKPLAQGLILVSGPPNEPPQWQGVAPGTGIWQQLDDVTLSTLLAPGVRRTVAIPDGVNDIDYSIMIPQTTGIVNPNVCLNGQLGNSYSYALTGVSPAGAAVVLRNPNTNRLYLFHANQVTVATRLFARGRITQGAASTNAFHNSQGITGQTALAETTGEFLWAGTPRITAVSFGSDAVLGLPAGTRIIVRGAIP